METKPNDAKQAIQEDIKRYRELQAIADQEAFQAYSASLINTVVNKMIWAFTESNIKDWNDFCKLRGEVVARLQPLQEVHGAQAMIDHLTEQLNSYFNSQS